jgi:hypothetical protein
MKYFSRKMDPFQKESNEILEIIIARGEHMQEIWY